MLYRHNLHDGTAGIRGDKIVQEQIELHPADAAPTATSADVDPESPGQDHSAVHIGERQWGTVPTTDSDAESPDPSLEIEVDYYEGVETDVLNGAWRQTVEDNYAIYDIDVEFVEGLGETDPLTDGNLCEGMYVAGSCLYPGEKHWPPFDDEDVEWIRGQYRDTDGLYMFVGTLGGVVPASNPGETESEDGEGDHTIWIEIYSQGQGDLDRIPDGRLNMDDDEVLQSAVRSTTVHEIGHVFDAGDVEVSQYGVSANEVYSGCPPNDERPDNYGCTVEDPTPELVHDQAQGQFVREWSVMSAGTRRAQYLPPTNERYSAFSIEELFTVNSNDPALPD